MELVMWLIYAIVAVIGFLIGFYGYRFLFKKNNANFEADEVEFLNNNKYDEDGIIELKPEYNKPNLKRISDSNYEEMVIERKKLGKLIRVGKRNVLFTFERPILYGMFTISGKFPELVVDFLNHNDEVVGKIGIYGDQVMINEYSRKGYNTLNTKQIVSFKFDGTTLYLNKQIAFTLPDKTPIYGIQMSNEDKISDILFSQFDEERVERYNTRFEY